MRPQGWHRQLARNQRPVYAFQLHRAVFRLKQVACANILHQGPCFWREHHLAGLRLLFCQAHLQYRFPGNQEFPTSKGAPDVHGAGIAYANRHAHRKTRAGRGLVIAQFFLCHHPTLCSAQYRGARIRIRFANRPDRQQRIPGEFDHVAAVFGDQRGQLTEIIVQNAAQFFRASRTLLAQRFCQCRKARNIGKQNRRRELLMLGCDQRSRVGSDMVESQCGDVTGKCIQKRRHGRALSCEMNRYGTELMNLQIFYLNYTQAA